MTFLEDYDAAGAQQMALVAGWLQKTPREFFAELRAMRPMLRTPGFLIVTRYPDVQEVLGLERVFSVRGYQSRMDPVAGPFMLARDATILNERDKGIMRAMLSLADLPRVRSMTGRLTVANMRQFATSAGLEIVSAISRRVPLQVCGEYFGFPGPDMQTMMRWSRATQMDMFRNAANSPEVHAASVRAGEEMRIYLTAHIAMRRRDARHGRHLDDALGRLLQTSFPPAVGFPEERIIANIMGLLIGAGETTSQAIVHALDQLFRRPEKLEEAREAAAADDDAGLAAIVWEALRFNPISPGIARFCEQDHVLARGTEREIAVPKGSVVFAATLSAMFDERQLPDAEDFVAGRPDHHYFHFGYGHHVCLGNHVGEVLIPEVLKHLLLEPGLRRVEGPKGQIDYRGGPFPEEWWVGVERPAIARVGGR